MKIPSKHTEFNLPYYWAKITDDFFMDVCGRICCGLWTRVMTGIVAGIFFMFTIHTPPRDIIVAGERILIGLVGRIWAIAL